MTTKLPERATLATAPAQPAGWKFERVDDRHIRVEDPAASYAVVIDMGDQAPVMRVFWRLCVDLIEWAASAAAPAVPPRAGDGNLPPLPEAFGFAWHEGSMTAQGYQAHVGFSLDQPPEDYGAGPVFTVRQMRSYARAALAAAPAVSAPTWQPIETAPRDRTEVLVWREDAGQMIASYTSAESFCTQEDLDQMDEEAIFSLDWFTQIGYRMEGSETPTHWQPLPAEPGAPSPVPAHDPADTVQLVGVKDGVETVIGTATMSPRMKAQDLVREMFGAWEHDDGSDADMAFAVCEQLIKWMPLNPPVFNVQAPAVRDEEPADSAVRQDAERWRALQLMWKADVIAGMDENGRALRTRHAGPWGLTERVDAKRATLAAQPPVQGTKP
jgi:hypothetical protein